MTNFTNFVEDKILEKKLGMMEKRLEEGLEKKLEGALSATSAATGLSMEDEEKMMANQIIDQSVIPNVTDPKLIEVDKALEHKISDTVIDTMAELKIKVAAGEKVSEEEEAQRLEQNIIATVLAMFENEPEEKRAALEKALKESFKKMLANGKRRSLQQAPDFTALFDAGSQLAQSLSSSGLLDAAPPEVKLAVDSAAQVISNPVVQNALQDMALKGFQGFMNLLR